MDQLPVGEVEAAVAAHPKIGAAPAGPEAADSRREQSGVDAGDADLASALAEGNRAYEQRFGRTYLVCASGRSGHELLAMLHERLGNDPGTELAVTRAELGKINRLRLERLVAS
jgi:2-oxo-4-hydroxy-4-carboxy-5-ureidoimidazoline decarboxylase